MTLPAALVAALALGGLLFIVLGRCLRLYPAGRVLPAAAGIVAAARVIAVASGGYLLSASGGWVQLPAYLLTLVGLPELAFAPREARASFSGWLPYAVVLVAAGSVAWVLLIGVLAAATNRRSTR